MSRQPQPALALDIQVDAEFVSLIPPLSAPERDLLETSLRQEGLRERLIVWKETNILLDGHNRFLLCRTHAIEVRVTYLSFPGREAARNFIIHNQLGRRNLTPEAASYLRGQRYLSEKKSHGGDRTTSRANGQSDHLKTAGKLAQEFKVGEKTIRRDAKFALAVDAIVANCGEEVKQLILSKENRLLRNRVIRLSKLKPKEQQAFFEHLTRTGKPPRQRTTRKEAATMTLPTKPQALAEALRRKFSRADLDHIVRVLSQVQGKAKKSQ